MLQNKKAYNIPFFITCMESEDSLDKGLKFVQINKNGLISVIVTRFICVLPLFVVPAIPASAPVSVYIYTLKGAWQSLERDQKYNTQKHPWEKQSNPVYYSQMAIDNIAKLPITSPRFILKF